MMHQQVNFITNRGILGIKLFNELYLFKLEMAYLCMLKILFFSTLQNYKIGLIK